MEEKVINDILHYRYNENEEWKPFTIEAITIVFISVRRAYDDLVIKMNAMNNCYDELQRVLYDAKRIR